MDTKQSVLSQLDDVLSIYQSRESKQPESIGGFQAAAMAAIHRIAGPDSSYAEQAVLKYGGIYGPGSYGYVPYLAGVIKTLRHDVQAGYLTSVRELAHGEVFGDLLEQADYLLNEGFKDPAAVIAGCALEAHLHSLCTKHGIDTEAKTDTDVKPKKADRLNSDLAGADVYGKLDQKQVTAWLDLRNKAAHAHFDDYAKQQVALMIQGIRDFLVRVPA